MPIYEYRCSTCGERVEVLVRSAATAPACPRCGGPLTDKLFSVPNILSAETRRPAGHTCCDRDEQCDESACLQGQCWHD